MNFDCIPGRRDWAEVRPIHEGWSGEEKLYIRAKDGAEYLLRLADADRAATRRGFEGLQRFAGLPFPRAIAIGERDGRIWALLTWVPGTPLDKALPALAEGRQYALGLEAGRLLREIHTLSAPADTPDWAARFGAKIDRKLRMYADCPLRYEDDTPLLACVAANRHLLAGRPSVFQHGDYHVGNMLLSPEGELRVIDFSSADFGDPWEEFNRIVWSAQASPTFARGQLQGYFPDGVPETFWKLLQLYLATNALGALPWAIPFGEAQIEVMRAQYRDLSGWYDGFRREVPSWYEPR